MLFIPSQLWQSFIITASALLNSQNFVSHRRLSFDSSLLSSFDSIVILSFSLIFNSPSLISQESFSFRIDRQMRSTFFIQSMMMKPNQTNESDLSNQKPTSPFFPMVFVCAILHRHFNRKFYQPPPPPQTSPQTSRISVIPQTSVIQLFYRMFYRTSVIFRII